jgi:hypothetical protein
MAKPGVVRPGKAWFLRISMRKMKAAQLVFDWNLYPRNNLDSANLRMITDARRAGDELPPVLIDKKSKRLVDGFHRTRATIAVDGSDAMIMVIEKLYHNDSEIFLDAVRLNAIHGARLDSCDRTRCLIIAERLKIDPEKIAGALHVSTDRLGPLMNTRTAKDHAGLRIPLKRTIRSRAGTELTDRQVEANQRLSGMSQVFYANQLIELIEAKLLDLSDERLLERLKKLHSLLDDVLAAK